jgi:hypothetical protein
MTNSAPDASRPITLMSLRRVRTPSRYTGVGLEHLATQTSLGSSRTSEHGFEEIEEVPRHPEP